MAFIPMIRERRMEKHYNQKQLAEKMLELMGEEITTSRIKSLSNTISLYEKGVHYPPLEKLYWLCVILECQVQDLYHYEAE